VILDFGLAKLAGAADLTKTGSTLGTVPYMSPEQARGEHLDQRTDIWSLGVIFYEMLAGQRPFIGEYDQAIVYTILNEDPAPLRSIKPEIPEDLERIVSRMLDKDPESRYQEGEVADDLAQFLTPGPASGAVARFRAGALLRPSVVIPTTLVAVLLVAVATWFFNRQSKIRWVRQEAMPELRQLVEAEWRDYTDAYQLATEIEAIMPDDLDLLSIFEKISLPTSVHTTPAGADVYAKEYQTPEADWRFLGVSPLDSVRMPIGVFRWRLVLDGYDSLHAVASSWDIGLGGDDLFDAYVLERELQPRGTTPAGMVHVPAMVTRVGRVGDFYIDATEVTNREFKEFVDAGGYRSPEFWTQDFVREGVQLSWSDATALMVDQTGRPGPSTWQAGSYQDGQSDHPVTGVSWYEASAYAEFAGKSLPTSTHWGIARGEGTPIISWPQLGGHAIFAPFSNFGQSGTVAAGSLPGITAYGAYDMAGNVREWCLNESAEGRILRGGAWGDNTYMFGAPSQAPAIDRSHRNGFRCAVYPEPDSIPEAVKGRMEPAAGADFYAMKPVSDEVFQAYREMFAYDAAPLNAETELRSDESADYVYERVTYDAAYGGERIIGHLFLPRNATPPFQTVVYFPGGAAMVQSSSEGIQEYYEYPIFLSFLAKNGRAVLFPVYSGTFERQRRDMAMLMRGDSRTRAYSDYIIDVVKDFERSVDYLESRDDIDAKKIAYYGMSWGGIMGAIIPAIEQRLATAVVLSGGLRDVGRPEVHQLNYVGRISMPILMLNGTFDSIFPLERSIRPMFDLIGTPDEQKELRLFESDHIIPKNDQIREMLDWLDRYLGPVN
jgi:dienelactone hydrolase